MCENICVCENDWGFVSHKEGDREIAKERLRERVRERERQVRRGRERESERETDWERLFGKDRERVRV